MIYLSAQPAEFYFKWQLEVLLYNFSKLGIVKENIHILFAYRDKVDSRIVDFANEYSLVANFFFYEDTRENIIYSSSIRPHIIKKHLDFFPGLQEEVIFYHDADIIFRAPLNLQELINDDNTWYLSDTNSYIGIDFLNTFNPNIVHEMCAIVGISSESVFENYTNFGGAQYVIKNTTIAFWQKHERDCNLLYTFLTEQVSSFKKKRASMSEMPEDNQGIDFDYLQAWCSDMWSMVLNGLYFGHKIQVHSELEFCWPKDDLIRWEQTKILHNAGVTKRHAHAMFYKGYFKDYSPFDIKIDFFDRNICTIKYLEEIYLTAKAKRFKALDTVFLYIIRIDSEERYRNLQISIAYVNKFFTTKIFVIEIDSSQKIDPSDFDKDVEISFIHDNEAHLNRTKYFNQFARGTEFKKIAYLDCDCFTAPSAIKECIDAISEYYVLGLPFDGSFINIKDIEKIQRFGEALDLELLKSAKKDAVILRSFGGGVFVNTKKYLHLNGENEEINGWGIDDIDRVARVLISGGIVYRAEGSLYHLDHPRKSLDNQNIEKNVNAPLLELSK